MCVPDAGGGRARRRRPPVTSAFLLTPLQLIASPFPPLQLVGFLSSLPQLISFLLPQLQSIVSLSPSLQPIAFYLPSPTSSAETRVRLSRCFLAIFCLVLIVTLRPIHLIPWMESVRATQRDISMSPSPVRAYVAQGNSFGQSSSRCLHHLIGEGPKLPLKLKSRQKPFSDLKELWSFLLDQGLCGSPQSGIRLRYAFEPTASPFHTTSEAPDLSMPTLFSNSSPTSSSTPSSGKGMGKNQRNPSYWYLVWDPGLAIFFDAGHVFKQTPPRKIFQELSSLSANDPSPIRLRSERHRGLGHCISATWSLWTVSVNPAVSWTWRILTDSTTWYAIQLQFNPATFVKPPKLDKNYIGLSENLHYFYSLKKCLISTMLISYVYLLISMIRLVSSKAYVAYARHCNEQL